ncbi:hypothetical protein, partial [Proteus mirabilis]|uniref:hypothetical protein n=1 Tax=Proteus mirabilis TaxID=584 RepID=UPI0019549B6C
AQRSVPTRAPSIARRQCATEIQHGLLAAEREGRTPPVRQPLRAAGATFPETQGMRRPIARPTCFRALAPA